MKKVIEWFGGGLVKDLLGGLDKLFTSKEEKIKAENVIKQILIEKQLELQKMQTEIIVAEAKGGSWLQRSWRYLASAANTRSSASRCLAAAVKALPTCPLS